MKDGVKIAAGHIIVIIKVAIPVLTGAEGSRVPHTRNSSHTARCRGPQMQRRVLFITYWIKPLSRREL